MGFDISRFTPGENRLARRRELFRLFQIDLVLDIGANTGQFAFELRSDIGYTGRIISFEPMRREFDELEKRAKGDPRWETKNYAIGDSDEEATIHVAGNSLSSSLLPMKDAHLDAAPNSKYVGDETINVRKLDSVFDDLHKGEKSVFLKIDTQGFESRVLQGAERSLESIDTIQLEMSLVPVYENEVLFTELLAGMIGRGFYLASIDEVFSNPKTGELLQVDGLFHRGADQR
jgi:FkbM family methyltransferase